MPQTVVLVTFYSRGGATEKLATAAAVGAVQARAAIRLRRLPDHDSARTLERWPDHADALQRMQKEYASPREADVLTADVLVLASPPDVGASAPEWVAFADLLAQLDARGALAGKVCAVLHGGPASDSLASLVQRFALVPVPAAADSTSDDNDVNRSIALGRRAVVHADGRRGGT